MTLSEPFEVFLRCYFFIPFQILPTNCKLITFLKWLISICSLGILKHECCKSVYFFRNVFVKPGTKLPIVRVRTQLNWTQKYCLQMLWRRFFSSRLFFLTPSLSKNRGSGLPPVSSKEAGRRHWRTDLRASEPYWRAWFEGMSQAFLDLKGAPDGVWVPARGLKMP